MKYVQPKVGTRCCRYLHPPPSLSPSSFPPSPSPFPPSSSPSPPSSLLSLTAVVVSLSPAAVVASPSPAAITSPSPAAASPSPAAVALPSPAVAVAIPVCRPRPHRRLCSHPCNSCRIPMVITAQPRARSTLPSSSSLAAPWLHRRVGLPLAPGGGGDGSGTA
ncbi:hypothetical protein EDB85DRAFT_1974012 [Lactarius pseudohatsudake]|nr:hypothetical protein EDB85DRAFT_1974012 [Lactarius pseudohatsudake]